LSKIQEKEANNHSYLFRAKQYLVEQFNGHFKAYLLKDCYLRPKGLKKKAAVVYEALIGCDVEALRALVFDEFILKSVSKYRGLNLKIFTVCVIHTFQTGKSRLKAPTHPQQYISRNPLKKNCAHLLYLLLYKS
jgi:hypothetical protein